MHFLPLIIENVNFIFYKFSPAQVKLSCIHILLKYTKKKKKKVSIGLALMARAPSVEYLNSVNDVTWLLKSKKWINILRLLVLKMQCPDCNIK